MSFNLSLALRQTVYDACLSSARRRLHRLIPRASPGVTRRGAEYLWGEMVEEKALDERSTPAHTDLVEDMREVLLNGVLGDAQRSSDLFGRRPLRDTIYDRALSFAQPVRGGAQPGQFTRMRRLDDDYCLALTASVG